MVSKVTRIFLLALLIRLLVAPWFYHPDIKSQHFHFQFLSNGVADIYNYISTNKSHLPYTDTFNYLPLTYFLFGALQVVLRLILPADFIPWINDWSQLQYQNPQLPVFMLILKLPYLLLDLAVAFLLLKTFPKTKTYLLWLFNPIVIYLVYVLGNFDILPSALTLLSFCLIKRQRLFWAGLVFGIATAVKLYPLIFLPSIAISLISSPKSFLKFLYGLVVPLLLTLLPFVASPDFWQSFMGSGLTQKLLAFRLGSIPIFPPLYLFIIIFFRRHSIPFQISLIGLLFLSAVNFHPQWLLWFLPFLTISLTSTKLSSAVFLFSQLLFLFYVVLFNDQFLFWGHLIPVSPLFLSLTTPYDLLRLRLGLNPTQYQSLIKLLMSFLLVFLAVYYRKSDSPDNP